MHPQVVQHAAAPAVLALLTLLIPQLPLSRFLIPPFSPRAADDLILTRIACQPLRAILLIKLKPKISSLQHHQVFWTDCPCHLCHSGRPSLRLLSLHCDACAWACARMGSASDRFDPRRGSGTRGSTGCRPGSARYTPTRPPAPGRPAFLGWPPGARPGGMPLRQPRPAAASLRSGPQRPPTPTPGANPCAWRAGHGPHTGKPILSSAGDPARAAARSGWPPRHRSGGAGAGPPRHGISPELARGAWLRPAMPQSSPSPQLARQT